MERKDLEAMGLEKEVIDKIMGLHETAIGKEQEKTKTAEADRDKYKEQYETTSGELDKLKELKPEELQATIDKLKEDMKRQEKEYEDKEAERLFHDTLEDAIKTAGGRNVKSVMALLNMAELKESKNQSEDIKKALDTIKESDAYLFGADEPFNNPVGTTNNQGGGDSTIAAMRAAAGLEPKK